MNLISKKTGETISCNPDQRAVLLKTGDYVEDSAENRKKAEAHRAKLEGSQSESEETEETEE